MIEYHYELPFDLLDEGGHTEWITRVVLDEGNKIVRLSYVFCDDNYLLKLNQEFLDHNTLTDILTFPYSDEEGMKGEIFISVERVQDNAKALNIPFDDELKRVMIHGVLHLLGYTDRTAQDKRKMRAKEEEKIKMFHVEQ